MTPVKSLTEAWAAASTAPVPGSSGRIRGLALVVAPLLARVRDAGGAAAHTQSGAPRGPGRAPAGARVRQDSVPGVELDMQADRAADAEDPLPGCWRDAADTRHAARHHRQCPGQCGLGEMCTEAVVDAPAEGEHGRRPGARNVEMVRIVIDSRIAAGARCAGRDCRAGRNDHPAQLDVFDGDAYGAEDDG